MYPGVAEALGIRTGGFIGLMNQIAVGLPVSSLDTLMSHIAPKDVQFRERLVSRSSLARRKKAVPGSSAPSGRLSSEEGDKLVRLAAVWTKAVEVWGAEDAARRFLFTPHMLLENRTPVDVVLASEHGRPAVEDILGRLEAGTAV